MTYAGSWRLVRHDLRRDRVLIAVWYVVLALTAYASAAATRSLYPTEAQRVAAGEALDSSPAVVALYGPVLDVRSLGEVSMTKLTVLYAVIASILFVVLVRRHTRVAEEQGLAELLGGTPVGRHAPDAAAVVTAALVAVGLGVLVALAAVAGGLPVGGSLLFGASWLGTGLAATGVAAVACQVSASARTCAGVAAGVVALLYVLRAVGDTGPRALSWLTPYGWNTRLQAWSEPRVWVLALYLVLAAGLLVLAAALRGRRDLGSGLLPDRPGPAQGSPRLGDVLALTARLHAASLAVWTVAVAALGVVFGAIAPGIGSLLDSAGARAMIARMGGEGAVERSLLAAVLNVDAVVITCFAISVVTRASGDEGDGRTEQVLATGVRRGRQWTAVALVALLGGTWLVLVTGVATALGYGSDLAAVAGSALAQAPALWVTASLTLLAWSLRAGWAVLGWAFLGAFLLLGLVGELLRLPRWAVDLSPYARVPQVPTDAFRWGPELGLAGVTAVVLAAGWLGYRRRDVG